MTHQEKKEHLEQIFNSALEQNCNERITQLIGWDNHEFFIHVMMQDLKKAFIAFFEKKEKYPSPYEIYIVFPQSFLSLQTQYLMLFHQKPTYHYAAGDLFPLMSVKNNPLYFENLSQEKSPLLPYIMHAPDFKVSSDEIVAHNSHMTLNELFSFLRHTGIDYIRGKPFQDDLYAANSLYHHDNEIHIPSLHIVPGTYTPDDVKKLKEGYNGPNWSVDEDFDFDDVHLDMKHAKHERKSFRITSPHILGTVGIRIGTE